MVIIGDGQQREMLEKNINDDGLTDKVIFTGIIGNVNEWYQAIDCLLMPSLYEGVPITLIEAQTAGVNCICSDIITNQVKLTDLIKFESLNQTPSEWSKQICINEDRESYYKKILEEGFDIRDTTRELEKIYFGNDD